PDGEERVALSVPELQAMMEEVGILLYEDMVKEGNVAGVSKDAPMSTEAMSSKAMHMMALGCHSRAVAEAVMMEPRLAAYWGAKSTARWDVIMVMSSKHTAAARARGENLPGQDPDEPMPHLRQFVEEFRDAAVTEFRKRLAKRGDMTENGYVEMQRKGWLSKLVALADDG